MHDSFCQLHSQDTTRIFEGGQRNQPGQPNETRPPQQGGGGKADQQGNKDQGNKDRDNR